MPDPQVPAPPSALLPLSQALRAVTASLHRQVESAPVIAALLHGRLAPSGYALLLRQFEPIYAALEARIAADRQLPDLLRTPALARGPGLHADLCVWAGPSWRQLPLLSEAEALADGVLADGATAGTSAAVLGLAYVRYLGDLAGGQTLARVLARQHRVAEQSASAGDGLAFYRFGEPGPAALAAALRAMLDAVGAEAALHGAVQQAALAAFAGHAALFAALSARIEQAA